MSGRPPQARRISLIGPGRRDAVLLAGVGSIAPGRHFRYPDETPLANLWRSMRARMDADTARLGDATGLLPGLDRA